MSGLPRDPWSVDALRVDADLFIDVDGTPAHLRGAGSHLVLSSPHPERVWAAAVGSALPAGVGVVDGPRAVGRLADALAGAGLSLDVTGPHGSVVRLGAGVSSALGRVSTGSAAVRPGPPLAVGAVVLAPHRRVLAPALAVLAAVVLWWARRARR